jgi:iron complex transport system substrate-binding protein
MLSPLQLVTQLGATDKVVAVGNNIKSMGENKSFVLHEHPELKNLPDIGTTSDPSSESIIQVKPDAILGTIHTGKDISATVSQNTNVPFLYLNPNETFQGEGGAYEIWRKLALIFGNDEKNQAEELIRICNYKISEIEKKTSTLADSEKPKVLLVSAMGDSLVTSSSYEPINIAGGINVAEGIHTNSINGMYVIAIEQIISWNPDIILVHSGSSLTVDKILSDPNFQFLNAIKNKQVYYTKAWFTGWDPATGLCECLYFAKLFNPNKFSDLNVENECNSILEKFYGESGLYDWMLQNGFNFYTWK